MIKATRKLLCRSVLIGFGVLGGSLTATSASAHYVVNAQGVLSADHDHSHDHDHDHANNADSSGSADSPAGNSPSGPVQGQPLTAPQQFTYSYVPSGLDCPGLISSEPDSCITQALSSFMPAGFEAAIDAAFDAWEAVANVQFQRVTDSGSAVRDANSAGDIRIGGHKMDGAFGTLGYAVVSNSPFVSGPGILGDIFFDVDELWKVGFGGPGFDIFQVAAHEIGHSLGLPHLSQDDFPNSLLNPFYTEAFRGPQAADIAAIQRLYPISNSVPTPALLPGLIGLGVGVLRKRRRKAAV